MFFDFDFKFANTYTTISVGDTLAAKLDSAAISAVLFLLASRSAYKVWNDRRLYGMDSDYGTDIRQLKRVTCGFDKL